ncbi:MAG TPA: hypothetical protein VFZ00_26575, partial [Solirubrobacter sp.]|nr:hypothetical protein [Solirubrobacter sp.]
AVESEKTARILTSAESLVLVVRVDEAAAELPSTSLPHGGSSPEPHPRRLAALLDDTRLAALVAGFHPRNANVNVYRQAIDQLLTQFREEVAPIERSGRHFGNAHREAVRVVDTASEDAPAPDRPPMALIVPYLDIAGAGASVHVGPGDYIGQWRLLEWIAPELRDAAAARSEAEFGWPPGSSRSQIQVFGRYFSDDESLRFPRDASRYSDSSPAHRMTRRNRFSEGAVVVQRTGRGIARAAAASRAMLNPQPGGPRCEAAWP